MFGGAGYAIHTGDSHWINRSGALMAAIGALAALKVALLEEHRRKIDNCGSNAVRRSFPTPFGKWVSEQRRRYYRVRLGQLDEERARMVLYCALVAVAGEVLHGIGDLLFKGIRFVFHKVVFPGEVGSDVWLFCVMCVPSGEAGRGAKAATLGSVDGTSA
jgi:hypothetical protein